MNVIRALFSYELIDYSVGVKSREVNGIIISSKDISDKKCIESFAIVLNKIKEEGRNLGIDKVTILQLEHFNDSD